MCSFFGDVKYYSSRAFLDEEEEEDEDYQVPFVKLVLNQPKPENVRTVVVSFGNLANVYCKDELLDGSCIALGTITATYTSSKPLEETDSDSLQDDSAGKLLTLASIYLKDATLLVLCCDRKDSDVANDVARKILELSTSSSSFIVITTQHNSKLRAASATCDGWSDDLDRSVITHSVRSPPSALTSPQKSAGVKPLPQPAIVDSVPAAVLTACTMQRLPCVVYVSYTETISSTDVGSIRAEFNSVLETHDVFPAERASRLQRVKLRHGNSAVVAVPDIYV